MHVWLHALTCLLRYYFFFGSSVCPHLRCPYDFDSKHTTFKGHLQVNISNVKAVFRLIFYKSCQNQAKICFFLGGKKSKILIWQCIGFVISEKAHPCMNPRLLMCFKHVQTLIWSAQFLHTTQSICIAKPYELQGEQTYWGQGFQIWGKVSTTHMSRNMQHAQWLQMHWQ